MSFPIYVYPCQQWAIIHNCRGSASTNIRSSIVKTGGPEVGLREPERLDLRSKISFFKGFASHFKGGSEGELFVVYADDTDSMNEIWNEYETLQSNLSLFGRPTIKRKKWRFSAVAPVYRGIELPYSPRPGIELWTPCLPPLRPAILPLCHWVHVKLSDRAPPNWKVVGAVTCSRSLPWFFYQVLVSFKAAL